MDRRTAQLAPHDAVIGLDFGGTTIDVALADGDGTLLDRVRLDARADDGPDQALRRAADAARGLAVRANEVHQRAVVAHAAVTAGVPLATGVLLAPNLPGWEYLPFQALLAQFLQVDQLTVANDVRAGALAEFRRGALQECDPALYVNLGTGLAAAVIVGGRVVGGAHGTAGEIGYTTLDLTRAPVPETAPLEDLVGGRGLGRAATKRLGAPHDAAALFARTDHAATGIVTQSITALAAALANLCLLIDPARIALGGGVMANAERILPLIRQRLVGVGPGLAAPEVVAARFTHDASLHGAITLALDAVGDERELREPAADGASYR